MIVDEIMDTPAPLIIPDYYSGFVTIQPFQKGWTIFQPSDPARYITITPSGKGWTIYKSFDGDFDDD